MNKFKTKSIDQLRVNFLSVCKHHSYHLPRNSAEQSFHNPQACAEAEAEHPCIQSPCTLVLAVFSFLWTNESKFYYKFHYSSVILRIMNEVVTYFVQQSNQFGKHEMWQITMTHGILLEAPTMMPLTFTTSDSSI